MVGGLVLSQAQTHHTAAPRTAAPAPAQALEKRPRDQAQPCGTAAAAVSVRSLDEVRKAHARHIKLGLDRSPRHARPLLAACALSGWPGGMELAASIFESLVEPEAFDYNTLMRGHVGGDREPAAALRMYVDMLEAGVRPDSYTFPFALKACAQLAALQEGRQVTASARTQPSSVFFCSRRRAGIGCEMCLFPLAVAGAHREARVPARRARAEQPDQLLRQVRRAGDGSSGV